MQKTIHTTGLDALYLASIDSCVKRITAVAGFPITAVAEKFIRDNDGTYDFHWFTSEKSAMETALGASVCGCRSLVLVKHVGMNLLADPLITSVTHTIGAGVVILAGDDPAAFGSQNEQDSRWYGKIAEIAVFDPSGPETAYECLIRAFEISEEASAPVIVRVTDRLEKSEGRVLRITPRAGGRGKLFDPSVWKLTMHGKHQLFHLRSQPILTREAEKGSLNRVSTKGSVGVISSGFPSAIVDELLSGDEQWNSVSHLALGVVSPFPYELAASFVRKHERILVTEESEPFIESHTRIFGNVYGKETGHLPYGLLNREHIGFALENLDRAHVTEYTSIQTIAERGPRPICSDCPYMPLYHILRRLDVMIAGDMGCSIRTAPEPLGAVDTGFSLGGAISTACGFTKNGIAVIGDFGLAHSGIIGLINAVDHGSDVLVIVLQNDVAAMTGGQAAPDIKEAVRALVPDLEVFDPDAGARNMGEAAFEELERMIKEKLDLKGVSVIYVKCKCVMY
ncbi:thiamine pyrophosphate-dependent enzyme [Methanolobus chelungpuianus]|uniref:Indolepyruvate oxidoreductase subunit IorA n=1 Tax=Methanolobus chelungpuianus TaxID=502115 RepID=A0AAE3HAQ2_9EURY|nr:thiamine pyrophosphate-dependent enzyme [Methanolobus chelungpuianus]MCQ6962881.1 indolepyruvate ferredoxin oxidoreductase [Methanolobus chelungpuianus]